MGKEKIENLGFDEVNSYDNEEKVSLNFSQIIFRNLMSVLCCAEETRLVPQTGGDRQDGREKYP